MTPDQLSERRARLRAGLKQTIDAAIASGAAAYVHGGDLFDGPNPRSAELTWVARQLKRLADAGIPAFLIGGNHDVPKSRRGGEPPQHLFSALDAAHVFGQRRKVEWWTGDLGGVRIALGGLTPDPSLPPDSDPLRELEAPIMAPPADLRLLATHYAIEGRIHSQAEEPTVRRATIAELAGSIDAILVGHVHRAAVVDVAGVKVVFPGPTERMNFGEVGARCGYAEIRFTPPVASAANESNASLRAGFAVRHVSIEPQPMRREVVREADIDVNDPHGWLVELVRELSSPEQVLQISLVGAINRNAFHAIRSRDLLQLGNELNSYFDLDRRALTIAPEVACAAGPSAGRVSPLHEIEMVVAALEAATDDLDRRVLVRDALGLLRERFPRTDDRDALAKQDSATAATAASVAGGTSVRAETRGSS